MVGQKVLVADIAWIAAALLHREHPDRTDFSVAEIVDRAEKESGLGDSRFKPGVRTHVTQHCVAGKKPDPGRYRMLSETSPGRRRLYRQGDPLHPGRRNGKIVPEKGKIPPEYHALVDWYLKGETGESAASTPAEDRILALRGLGKEIWVAETPDDYVRRVREGWD
ncbi:MAG: hypothetical protein Q8P12_02270 [bacterium]|nr:hypothetical protein [bacterium]